jgi:hypothetical protein
MLSHPEAIPDPEEAMIEAAAAPSVRAALRTVEFYVFCVISFAAKSLLLIGLPYREWPVNTFYTVSLLLFFYCFFRFRQGLRAPFFVVVCLAAAVAVDVLGNKFGFYGHPFGPLRDYDEFAHFTGSGFSAVGAFWIVRAGTRRLGLKLAGGLVAVLSTSVAFSYCGWYEILELWDEYFWSGFERIHWWYDTANDLLYDFCGVILFIAAAAFIFKLAERTNQATDNLIPVRASNIFSMLPRSLLGFFVTTTLFGLAAWFEIFRFLDQQWFGRIHLVGNRDTAIYLEYELAACVVAGVIVAGALRLKVPSAGKPAAG